MAEFEQQQIPFKERRLRSTQMRRGFFLLPAIFTVGNLLCGYYACVSSLVGGVEPFGLSPKASGFVIRFDSLDGRGAPSSATRSGSRTPFCAPTDVVSFEPTP